MSHTTEEQETGMPEAGVQQQRLQQQSLRLVSWCNVWNEASAYHSDGVGSRIHLTADTGYKGATLCGKSFPARKGHPSTVRLCKRCLTKARKQGQEAGFTRNLDWVPSESY